jgi:hypothetical protein
MPAAVPAELPAVVRQVAVAAAVPVVELTKQALLEQPIRAAAVVALETQAQLQMQEAMAVRA